MGSRQRASSSRRGFMRRHTQIRGRSPTRRFFVDSHLDEILEFGGMIRGSEVTAEDGQPSQEVAVAPAMDNRARKRAGPER